MARNPKTTYAEYDPKQGFTVHRKLTFTHNVKVPGSEIGLVIKFHIGRGFPARVTINGEIPQTPNREVAWFRNWYEQADETAAKRYAELYIHGKSDIQLNRLPDLQPVPSPTEKLKRENAAMTEQAARLEAALQGMVRTLKAIKAECTGSHPNPVKIRREVEDELFMLESAYPELKGIL